MSIIHLAFIDELRKVTLMKCVLLTDIYITDFFRKFGAIYLIVMKFHKNYIGNLTNYGANQIKNFTKARPYFFKF